MVLAAGSLAAIVVAASVSRPFYLGRGPLGEQLHARRHADPMAARASWLQLPTEVALNSSQFLHDRESFAMDLLRTGRVSVARARSLAHVAVREAYTRRVPPALVLGVMLTENDLLKSDATSRVGAVGLMQVYPKHWQSALARKFGTDIGADSTNLKYGIFILGYLAERASVGEQLGPSWRKALLGYNGCVRGSITPTCHQYPDAVRRQVQRAAKFSCAGADFDRCVIEPLARARRDDPGAVSGAY